MTPVHARHTNSKFLMVPHMEPRPTTITQSVFLLYSMLCGINIWLKMSGRHAYIHTDNCDKKKRKHSRLWKNTIYDLKKQKNKLLKFYAESNEEKLIKNR
ncbi:hypothetical protein AAY473_034027 [Plecturocebus cupreus]